MDIIPVYAITAGGFLSLLLLYRFRSWIQRLNQRLSILISKHLIYPYFLRRHRLLGPWSRGSVVLQITFILMILFGFGFTSSIFPFKFKRCSLTEVGDRSGTLAVVLLIPLLVGSHHTFITDLLGTSLRTTWTIHRSGGIAMCLLCLVHVLVALGSRESMLLADLKNLFAVIGASSLAVLSVFSFPFLRRFSYEIFLRAHQALALLATYSLWQHLPTKKYLPRGYVYVAGGLYGLLLAVRVANIILRNGLFRYRRSRAKLTYDNGAVKIEIQLQKPLGIDPGKYINLWIPSVAFWAFLQSHPFMVLSWAPGQQHTIELLVDPQRGLTQELLYHAQRGLATNLLVMFGGPHGTSVAMKDFESILMVASGFGITTHLPYLKKLIYDYSSRQIRARRIHLVWQIRDKADAAVAQSLLNDALRDDNLDNSCILSISIFLESNDIPVFPFGKRATIYPGPAPLSEIFLEEVSGQYIKRSEIEGTHKNTLVSERPQLNGVDDELGDQRQILRNGKMLVTVSGYPEFRDQLRKLTRAHLEHGVEMVELDYQPS